MMSKTNKTAEEFNEEVQLEQEVEATDSEELETSNSENEASETDEAIDENEALRKEIETLKNDYFKMLADTENLKKRLQREHDQLRKYRIQGFAADVLPVLDNLERALKQETTDEALREGVQMIYDQLMASLKAEGVEPINALNQPFDPNIHQAMMTEEKEGVESNIVIEEFQKGYMLKDRILRASLVKVSQ
ncbi:nucleotide exchange factor GrpE [Erysipelothrix rhusiopathiae]|nr:nucleotide exchange factor GrpE [Erysipelothrix rhusiopathiae]UPU39284.1 nucleotide exchange factor GrpE [Erysipelothrix sp. Poltava]AWU41230.1 nucleotide exchange factor GrpE [Erysipelothrix rhusiopathiae]AYV34845.1 nucleotide exchange factor GrpE [Erysipelothrix rhusiopathiae]MCG4436812.1 nucleotide exchange factor GrpE [Erysipelothrix rhusiopathiae]MCG4456519.1 nucleotide exchange factor GrpE [Erysipelothrix rhusiopathiae]